MSTQDFSEALAKAEKLTQKVSDSLRPVAFQTILQELLRRERETSGQSTGATERSGRRRTAPLGTGSGTTARLMALVAEGVFAEQRSLSEIRQVLAERGFHYRLEELATPLTRLVRRKHLRRVRVPEGGKKTWRYSNF